MENHICTSSRKLGTSRLPTFTTAEEYRQAQTMLHEQKIPFHHFNFLLCGSLKTHRRHYANEAKQDRKVSTELTTYIMSNHKQGCRPYGSRTIWITDRRHWNSPTKCTWQSSNVTDKIWNFELKSKYDNSILVSYRCRSEDLRTSLVRWPHLQNESSLVSAYIIQMVI